MQRKALTKAAASSFIIALTMVGCSGAALDRPGVASNGAAAKQATRAMKALASQDGARAVAAAEAAVAANPDNDGYRALLGRSYLLAGRYSSAETSFTDAITLGNREPRTIVSLALVQVGLGKSQAALGLLETYRDILPAADYGLAVALAGDPRRGVETLTAAARDASADAKTRQNLAYAYALAGMWTEAKLMAAQDLAPVDVTRRIADWALTSNPDFAPERIAMMTGVAPRPDDGGLPVRLALAPPAPAAAPVQLAEAPAEPAQPAALPEPVAETSAEIRYAALSPVVQPLPTKVRQASASYSDTSPERIIRAPSTPIRVAAAKGFLPTAAPRSLGQPVANGSYAVQFGAFDSPAVAKEKFQDLGRRNAAVARFPLVQTSATVGGRLYHRAAIGGFADAASAAAMCNMLRAQGHRCFVRAAEIVSPGVAAKAKQIVTR